MSDQIVLQAEPRADVGKGASRRLRRLQEKVPAILYGGQKDPVNISFQAAPLRKLMQDETFFTQVLTLQLAGAEEPVLLKDVQRHPARGDVVHMDLVRVDLTKKVDVTVPLHFLNEEQCVGVKNEGGQILHNLVEVEVTCLPGDIPEYVEVDMLEVHLGDTLHLTDLKIPDGVEITQLALGEDHDQPVVAVHEPRGGSDAEEEEGEDEATGAADEAEDEG